MEGMLFANVWGGKGYQILKKYIMEGIIHFKERK